ncbi:hypothetical protein L208DRAFT_1180555, partial [Tricholoma matsutake]
MVNWADVKQIVQEKDVLSMMSFSLCSVYLWEILVTWDFEWSLLTKQTRFRWPLVCVLFFLCRYCMLLALIGFFVTLPLFATLQALHHFNLWTTNTSILCTSMSLTFRCIALWDHCKSAVVALGPLCLLHWVLSYGTMFVIHAARKDGGNGSCVITVTKPPLLTTSFFFTMGYDFVVLILTVTVLLRSQAEQTNLGRFIFQDGLVYFVLSFMSNCIPAVLNILDLNCES